VFLPNGGCERFTVDNGREFKSQLLHDVADILHIKIHHSTAMHSKGNASIERTIQSVHNKLAMYTEGDHNNWERHIPYALLSYNLSIHSSTLQTPYFLMYLRDVHLPFQEIIESKQYRKNPANARDNGFQAKLIANARKAFKAAATRQKQQDAKVTKRFNAKAWTRNFEVNDLVLFYDKTVPEEMTNKLWTFWSVYRIIGKINAVTFQIRKLYTPPDKPLVRIANIDLLKRYKIPVDVKKGTREAYELDLPDEDLSIYLKERKSRLTQTKNWTPESQFIEKVQETNEPLNESPINEIATENLSEETIDAVLQDSNDVVSPLGKSKQSDESYLFDQETEQVPESNEESSSTELDSDDKYYETNIVTRLIKPNKRFNQPHNENKQLAKDFPKESQSENKEPKESIDSAVDLTSQLMPELEEFQLRDKTLAHNSY
jgi:hypothetical protein